MLHIDCQISTQIPTWEDIPIYLFASCNRAPPPASCCFPIKRRHLQFILLYWYAPILKPFRKSTHRFIEFPSITLIDQLLKTFILTHFVLLLLFSANASFFSPQLSLSISTRTYCDRSRGTEPVFSPLQFEVPHRNSSFSTTAEYHLFP